jgi:hypothetical protein
MRYYREDPWGDWREDARAAMLAAVTANAAGREEGKPPFKMRQFMIGESIKRYARQQSDEERIQRALAIAAMWGVKVRKAGG